MLSTLLLVLCSLYALSSSALTNRPWELPVFPPNFDSLTLDAAVRMKTNVNISAVPTDRLIPRNLWIAFRKVPPNLMSIFMDNPPAPAETKSLMQMMIDAKKAGWSINLMNGDEAEDLFMETYFPDTSYLWAYNSIGDYAKVSKADLWRYAALYAFGGMYLDDDAYLAHPIDKVCVYVMYTMYVYHECMYV